MLQRLARTYGKSLKYILTKSGKLFMSRLSSMVKVCRMSVSACMFLGVIALSSLGRVSAQQLAFAADGTAQLPYPDNGPVLGQGVLLNTGIASTNVCITGGTRVGTPDKPLPQVTAVFVHSATDASTYFHQAGIAASAQVKGLVGGAGAIVSYISSQNFLRTSSMVSVQGRTEQRQYITPAGVTPKEGGATPDLAISQSISLTPHALELLHKDLSAFRKECGDGFIAVLVEGAELTGSITIQEQSSDSASTTAASLNGTYGPASFDIKMTDAMKQSANSSTFSFSYVESGGSGQVVPTDQAGLTQALSHLPQVAQSAPEPLYVMVRDYSTLPNWPHHGPPLHADADSLSQIMELYWRINAVYQQAIDAEQSPKDAMHLRYMMGFDSSTESLDNLIDKIRQVRVQLSSAAIECYEQHSCQTPNASAKDIYALAVQLPLPVPAQTPAAINYFAQFQSIVGLINNFTTLKLQRVRSVSNIHDPTCYQENHKVTQQFEQEGFPGNIQGPLTQFAALETNLPAQLRQDAVEYYGHEVALRRCADSPTSADCEITLADFQSMGNAIPLHLGFSLHTNFYPTIDEYGKCPGGIMTTPTLTMTLQ
jgi:hypothetical protein